MVFYSGYCAIFADLNSSILNSLGFPLLLARLFLYQLFSGSVFLVRLNSLRNSLLREDISSSNFSRLFFISSFNSVLTSSFISVIEAMSVNILKVHLRATTGTIQGDGETRKQKGAQQCNRTNILRFRDQLHSIFQGMKRRQRQTLQALSL